MSGPDLVLSNNGKWLDGGDGHVDSDKYVDGGDSVDLNHGGHFFYQS